MWADLSNKVILVTGAGAGIGQALVQQLAKVGATVIAVARNEQQLQELVAFDKEHIKPLLLDLSDWENVHKVLSSKQVPQLDGLVNNAGVAIIKPFEQLSEADFDTHFDVNIKAVFSVTQALLPKLRDGSTIVNVSSIAASRSFAGHTAYSATKAAVDSLTKSLALELGPRRIRVNSVNPTVVLTRMGRDNWSEPSKSGPLLAHIPLNRFCEVHEVTDAIGYLLSEKSTFVNGHHINLEGGYSVS
ncbi:L-xylulose reductase [Drosophila sulfurigaster albostrigata]|uniref:L-xylulose reductase n=1 Tax=Drosophila sulfurigaster albostrigata TaxID=89887 RepID=UPI002D21DA9D|nr:L-xylulose reductase [Drosophila sulfurigaster albostrigata]